MKASSHALFLALIEDLTVHLPRGFPDFCSPIGSQKYHGPFSGHKQFASVSLVSSIFKKFEDNSSQDADAKALDLFIRMNNKCREFRFVQSELPTELQHVFSWAKTYIDNMLHSGPNQHFSPEFWLDRCDFGPGSSIAASGTSFYNKVGCSKLTATDPLLYSLYCESIRNSPTWVKAEKLRRDLFGRPDIISGNRLCFVPKSTEISRTICIEPSLNMFIQKGFAANLEMLLSKSIGFDLEFQQFRNKRLARLGSKTGRFSTIDLSSASDTISLEIVRALFPPDFVCWLELMRSPVTLLPNGQEVSLHMVSSMGNAFTFPLQTILFSAIALACYKVKGVDFQRPTSKHDGNLGVFGDDIIVETSCFDLLCRSIDAAGFTVNLSKSFNVGLFRESCGGDYFDGRNVRGIYCKSLKTPHAVYSLFNRLNVWSTNNGILLPRTISYLKACAKFLCVPPWESDIAGFKVPLSVTSLKRDGNLSIIYRRLQARSIEFEVNEESCSRKNRARVIYNPDAILLSAVKGTLRNGSISIRQDVVRPSYRFGIAPCWDYIDLEHSLLENVDLTVWKHTVIANLGFS